MLGYADCLSRSMAHIRKILVPVDGSPPSCAALARAVDLAEDLGATLDVLHVRGPNRFEIGSSTGATKSAQEDADHAMSEALAAANGRLGDRVKLRTESGDPVQEILAATAGPDVDLVVMGTHGRIGRLHAILGSVAEAIVRNSARPVLTVRAPDGESESFAERIHGRPGMAERKSPPG
jgi:nucleotide-binding universal stress UspA family protein